MYKRFKLLTLAGLSVAVFSSCQKTCDCQTPIDPKPETKTLSLQPGPQEGQDCLVIYRETDGGFYANANHNFQSEIVASRWTYNSDGAGEGTARGYLKFTGLSAIPSTATIKSAKLSLFGTTSSGSNPQGNSYYQGSPYAAFGDNKCWLKRVAADWDQTTIKWTNKPATTDVNQVSVSPSDALWNYNALNMDVTSLVKDMVSNKQLYGFCLQLQSEQIYRSIIFGSSERTDDATKRPKLVVEYEVK